MKTTQLLFLLAVSTVLMLAQTTLPYTIEPGDNIQSTSIPGINANFALINTMFTQSGITLPLTCLSGNMFQITSGTNSLFPAGYYACDSTGVWRSMGIAGPSITTLMSTGLVQSQNIGTGPIASTLIIKPGLGTTYLAASTTGTFTSGTTSITVASPAGILVGQTVVGIGVINNSIVTAISGNVLTVTRNTQLTEAAVPLQFWANYYGAANNLTMIDSTSSDSNTFNIQCCVIADPYSHNGYGVYLESYNISSTGLNPNHMQFFHIGEYTQTGQTSYLTHIGFGLGKGSHGSYYPFSVNQTGAAVCYDSNLDGTYTTGSTLLGSCKLSVTAGQVQSTMNLLEVQNNAGVAQTWVNPSYLMHQPQYTPSSSSAICTPGDFADDANYHYACTATNIWKRVALSSF